MNELMTLEQFLVAIQPGVKLSITDNSGVDGKGVELICLFSGGEDQLSSEILSRNVDGIMILGKSYLQIHLTLA